MSERDTLIDAIMPNPKGVDDALAYLAAEREHAEGVARERDSLRLSLSACNAAARHALNVIVAQSDATLDEEATEKIRGRLLAIKDASEATT